VEARRDGHAVERALRGKTRGESGKKRHGAFRVKDLPNAVRGERGVDHQ
jgi:hypothetical protein